MTINERIGIVVELSGENVNSYAKRIGIAQTSLRDIVKGNAEPKFSTLEKILIAEPLLNSEWLMLEKGEKNKNSYLLNEHHEVYKSNNEGMDYKEKYYEQLEQMNELRKRIDEFQAEEIERKNAQTGVGDVVAPARVG